MSEASSSVQNTKPTATKFTQNMFLVQHISSNNYFENIPIFCPKTQNQLLIKKLAITVLINFLPKIGFGVLYDLV